ncbi:MAG TPA: hypothetical protein VGQ58_03835 [Candidatus Limnocylindrales bacterium]|jgi:hypothetical protein|nr:hypothetical protein [Candidatus Limnocylindrales bacterium]
MANRSLRVPAAVVLIAFALAACTGGASRSDGAELGTTRAPATDSAPEASEPAATASLSGPLVDLIPDEIGGISLRKETVAGPDLVELEADDAASFAALLKNVEGPLEAFSAVNAVGQGIKIVAMRMEGTDGGQLGDAMVGVITDAAGGEVPVETVTIAGKEVTRIAPPDTVPSHVYVTGELMFVVQAEDPALVEEALAALP